MGDINCVDYMVIHVKYHEEKAQDSVEIVAFFEVGEINVYLGK